MILCFSEIIKGFLHLLRHIRYIHTSRDKQLPNLDRIQPQLICNSLQRHPGIIKHNSRIHQLFKDLPGIILRLRFPAATARPSWFIRSFLTHRSQNQLIHFEGHLANHLIKKCLSLDVPKTQFLIQTFRCCIVLDHIKPQRFLSGFSF